MANVNIYEHVPLPPGDEYIRLMSLEPGNGTDTLRCGLRSVKIRDARDYEALSYAVGDVDLRYELICEGRLLRVSTNLAVALRNLRQAHQPRTLWVDAVCVDQGESARSYRERENQIQLFCQIYDRSTRCIVFIGEPTPALREATRKLFDTSRTWGPAANLVMGFNGLVGALGGGITTLTIGSYLEQKFLKASTSAERKGAIEDLFARLWFERLWTYQEVLLSSTVIVQCGQYTANWESMKLLIPALRLADFGQTRRGDMLNFAAGRFYARQKFTQAHLHPAAVTGAEMDGISMPNMIVVLKRLDSGRPKDKVIGARSILEKLHIRAPPANYGLEIDQIYAAGTRCWALSKGQVNCLGLAATPKRQFKIGDTEVSRTLPSWVIDWKSGSYLDSEYVNRFLKVQETRHRSTQQARASSGSRSSIYLDTLSEQDLSSLSLTLRGVVLAEEVASFTGPIPAPSQNVDSAILESEPDDSSFYRALVQWMTTLCGATEIDTGGWLEHLPIKVKSFAELMRRRHPVARAWSKFVHDRHGLDAITKAIRLHVINSHQLKDRMNVNGFDVVYKDSLKKVPTSWRANTKLLANEPKVMEELTRHLKELMVSETLFVTTAGRVGMGFCGNLPMQASDIIALVEGSDYPLILRRTRSQGAFQFVGMAFVGGIMDGEAWPNGESNLRTLTLV